MRNEITVQEFDEILRENPPPSGVKNRFLRTADGGVKVEFSFGRGVLVERDGGANINTNSQDAARWALDIADCVNVARAKPAPRPLPDVSDLDGVTLYWDGRAVIVTVNDGGHNVHTSLVRDPAGWLLGSTRYAAAGIVAERLNRMEETNEHS